MGKRKKGKQKGRYSHRSERSGEGKEAVTVNSSKKWKRRGKQRGHPRVTAAKN